MKKNIFIIFLLVSTYNTQAQSNIKPFILSYKYISKMVKIDNGDIVPKNSTAINLTMFFYFQNSNKCKIILNDNPPFYWHNISILRNEEGEAYTSFKCYDDNGELINAGFFHGAGVLVQGPNANYLYSNKKY